MPVKTFSVPLPLHFSFKECIWFLDRNFDDCLHEIEHGCLRKAVALNGTILLFEIREASGQLEIEILQGSIKHKTALQDYIKNWFDLDRNLKPFYKLLKQDADLAFLAEKYDGLRLIGIPDLFEALCWSIIGQQINLRFAYTLKRRMVEKYGKQVVYANKSYYLFPEPVILEGLSVADLRILQFSERKASYIIELAKLFHKELINKEQLLQLPDEGAMFRELMSIRGVGEWTAHYALMKSLRHMNSITYGDSGLNTALFKIKGFDKKNNRKEIDRLFNNFEGWKSYLVFYLWRGLS